MGGILPLLVFGWCVSLLVGTVIAFRGRRCASTILLMIGLVCQILSAGGFLAGMILSDRSMAAARSSPGSPSPSSLVGGIETSMLIWGIAALLLFGGLILFVGGFIGLCARFAATERRAAELEGLVSQLQERMT
jgi:hypothetical protein